VVEPIDFATGEVAITAPNLRGTLSIVWQIVVCDDRFTQCGAVHGVLAVYQRRWPICIDIDFIFVAHFPAPD
jgi:hypothetical protein